MHTHLMLVLLFATLSPAWASILQQLFAIVIPPAAGWLATEVGLILPAINKLGTIGAGVINVVTAFLLGLGFTALGLPAPGGLSSLDAGMLAAALTAIVRIVIPVADTLRRARIRRGLKL